MNTTRFALLFLAACAGSEIGEDAMSGGGSGGSGGKADDTLSTRGLPADLAPWGGNDAAHWSPEAIIANAVTAELQRDASARVSVPATVWTSHYAPFGDGQTNAAASLAHWQIKRVPVIGVRRAGRVTVRFDRALPIGDDTFELWTAQGVWVKSVGSTRTSDGDRVVEFADAALIERVVISPRGWRDAFVLGFAMPIASIGSLPDAGAQLPGGEPVVDPVGAAGDGAYDVLRATSFPAGFNQVPYVTDNLHAAFPQSGAPRITAVGGAWTWVTEQPFKNMYVCLDQRSLEREAQYGVPSGAGWHQIGQVPEAIVSSVATEPLLVGYASASAPATVASGGTFAYGLDRATTYGLLQPGQAFTTPSGDFHWYAVHHAQKPCVQIWAR